MAAKKKQEIVTMRISLVGYWPEIWRLFRVPSAISLPSLHDVIQVVMGWSDSHLHEFTSENQRFVDPTFDDFGDVDALDSRTMAVSWLVHDPGDEFQYEYDFGDGWGHRLIATAFSQGVIDHAECLAGERQCPPEDVGGVQGFREFLEAVKDPKHEEHETMLTWCGGNFDSEDFSVKEVNANLEQHKLSTRLLKSKKPHRGFF